VGRKLAEIQRIQSILVTVYLLELAGATAVTSLGWAACRMLQIDWIPSAPLWFAGYLLIYNLDRLYPDPADLINIPFRSSKTEELRMARIGLAFLAASLLIVWSLLTSRWWLVLALAFVATVLQFYSRPVPGVGFRLKDLPYVKSFLPPGVIAGILVVWPCVENGRSLRLKECLVFVWCLLVLTINSLVFDYRDIDGDSAAGTGTIPVRLGRRNTIYSLIGLAAALVGVSAWLATRGFVSPLMPVALAGCSAGLLLAVIRRPCPMTISVLADLLLEP
jgi:4-hydroxybenzoate polyprenyltransferase